MKNYYVSLYETLLDRLPAMEQSIEESISSHDSREWEGEQHISKACEDILIDLNGWIAELEDIKRYFEAGIERT